MIKIKINNQEIIVDITKQVPTILEIAKEHGIEIPNLCYYREFLPFGSCWVCTVQILGRKGFVTACGTKIEDGMEVVTNSTEVIHARKLALELLLSDHFADCEAPCKIACPAHADVQSYISAIANGQYHEAVKIIKEKIPMPLSIGRVCPAFCEKECRRTLVEAPIAIKNLKRYCADMDLNDYWQWSPLREEVKKHRIAIVGAGPSGLTCGYYLGYQGYSVDLFEEMDQAGGWLRYGIPEYRLPKQILNKEIELMLLSGMKIHTCQKLGKDIFLDQLSQDYDAVYLALGSSKAVDMPLPGNQLQGVFLGVDFLKSVAIGEKLTIGKKVAVIGGGNTALDCARTALRLGSKVSIIYRRTRNEMPADEPEIIAAEKEGIRFLMLTNPVEYKGQHCLKEIVVEKMKLGEPDTSGRRKPVGTEEYQSLPFDTVIAAISQVPEISHLLENGTQVLQISPWSTVLVDEQNQFTGYKNIFAGGDLCRGPATAVEAIADGRSAAISIDRFLNNQPLTNCEYIFDSKKEKQLKDIAAIYYADITKSRRVHLSERDRSICKKTFLEVELGYSDPEAIKEATRCLECGCQKNENCQLRDYATEYQVNSNAFTGEKNSYNLDNSHPYISRDENKCIKCNKCIQVCAEINGAAVLGYKGRGFRTTITSDYHRPLLQTACDACGKCLELCPTGAIVAKHKFKKLSPRVGDTIQQNCGLCGIGCQTKIEVTGATIRQITGANLCFQGRFGWQDLENPQRIITPHVRINEQWKPVSLPEVKKIIKSKLLEYEQRTSFISPRSSLEELLLFQHLEKNCNFVLRCQEQIPDTRELTLYPNTQGFHFLQIVPQGKGKNIRQEDNVSKKEQIQDSLVMLYKHPRIRTKNCYLIEFDITFNPKSKAHLFIPTPSYLELDSHFINDFQQVCVTKNPKKSNLFYLLLNIFYETNLIPATQAEPSLWNLKISEMVKDLPKFQLDSKLILQAQRKLFYV